MVKKVLQPFYAVVVLITFFVCLLVAFPFFVLIGIKDKPEARKMIWNIVHYWAIGWLAVIGMPVRISGYKFDPNRKYVIVANHISYLDTVAIYAAIPTYFRTLAKKEMINIPVFGFVYKQLAILVDRSSAYSRAKSMRIMWRVIRTESSITVFPEGTFNETEAVLKDFYNGAFKLAISAQTPVLPLIFPDTVKRWHFGAWWKLWPGRNRAIFLEPIEVAGMEPEGVYALKEKAFKAMETELKKYGYPYHIKHSS